MDKDLIFDTESVRIEDTSRELNFVEKLKENQVFRKMMILVVLAGLWELVARYVNNPMMLPTFVDITKALVESLMTKNPENALAGYFANSMTSLFSGFGLGVLVAVIATIFAVNSRIGEDILHTITALGTPLPAVGVLPVAMLMFGLTFKMVLFVGAWATMFPVAQNMFMGFKTSSKTILNVGRNIGLTGIAYTLKVRIPDTLPSILTGLRTGFSNGFRALVALEMVIGAATGSGGLGWFIMNGKNQMDAPTVFAGLFATMFVGIAIEALFGFVEKHTTKKYGMMN
ncbi:ABC transporter permease subunit [Herbaspirillum sp. ST 5-3]|uniref:ABC transporter permease n=1 Tax=Oxalobacteraceae TaxID=75682 RepID=UPI0010A44C56|nr:ABC transporter permease subunit [Herbaspirillum sp. ST 5-3]